MINRVVFGRPGSRMLSAVFCSAIWCGALASQNLATPAARAERGSKSEFVYPKPRMIVYEGIRVTCEACASPLRQYTSRIRFGVLETKKPQALDPAVSLIQSKFQDAALKGLAVYTKSMPENWQDTKDEVCRAWRRQPSIVLPEPYWDDVEYCLRLVDDGDRPRESYHIQITANISVTKNGAGQYREFVGPDEKIPYEQVLVRIVGAAKEELLQALRTDGWPLTTSFGATVVHQRQ